MNSYELHRLFFDWCFENPDKVTPNHVAVYSFAIEHCNRLGWKEKFGFPTVMAKEAIGIKSYKTYINTLNDLVEWGFIKMIQKSTNQYSANIIALVKNTKALTKALTKASQKHISKHGESIYQSTGEGNATIDKPLTNEPLNHEPKEEKQNEVLQSASVSDFDKFNLWLRDKAPNVLKMQSPISENDFKSLKQNYSEDQIKEILTAMHNRKDLLKKYVSTYYTALNWLKREHPGISKTYHQPENKTYF